jgi:hypothetical protein
LGVTHRLMVEIPLSPISGMATGHHRDLRGEPERSRSAPSRRLRHARRYSTFARAASDLTPNNLH